jgi:radical SAM superfamily enzyme YgiQ (UPF0313 family)
MKKVFLVNPMVRINGKGYVRFLRDYAGGEIPTSMIYPPLDLAYTAALLRKSDISVTLLDASTLNIPPSGVVKRVIQEGPDFVGIPSAWGSIGFDIDLARELKDRLPSTKIVLWGPNVTVLPEIALSSGYIDYVILGEPEKPFLDIANGRFAENIAYRLDDRFIEKKRTLLEDLDWLPFPSRDLLPNERYIAPYVPRNPFTTILTSRGCPYSKCTFCPSNIWYMNRVRTRSVENVMREIDEIVNRFKIYTLVFRDQSLTFQQDRLLRICDEIIQRHYSISWRCFSGVKDVNRRLLLAMKEAGCFQIDYGFESGSQEILDLSNKGISLEESIRAARLSKELGIEVSGSFMLGMYGDTEETIKSTVEFALRLNLDYAEFLIAAPLPSTKFYEQCLHDGIVLTGRPQRWNNRSYTSRTLPNQEMLRRHLKSAYRRFYLRPTYLLGRLKKMGSIRRLIAQIKTAVSLFRGLLER